ncbi:SMP-30/gluconolactonase/LRE family protein [Salinicola aestuarinus]|uniref:SMP-30/gluconolactonase/LRE family protein n=1 Tax=Salinicola aestuarinus TaxID=1949082 RepID=UPI000DA117B4|nr:SMP-30/gluconolactonase/LRE family protein [Salinicola aestuarinus]
MSQSERPSPSHVAASGTDASSGTAPGLLSRRRLLQSSAVLSAAALVGVPRAQAEWEPSLRYPDANIEVLDPAFLDYRLFNASIERLATGFRWLEGPVWFGDGRYLIASDIANNRLIRWDEVTGEAATFRSPSNYSNGNTRDHRGRLITCEGSIGRRVTRTEYNGQITVLADQYQGKPFNSPNDVVCTRNGDIWFTDPPFQLGNNYEGRVVEQELPAALYRIDAETGEVTQLLNDIAGPNGLGFSADESRFFLVEGRAKPNRILWEFSHQDGELSGKTKRIEAQNHGAIDGFAIDVHGNIWAGWGSSGAVDGDPEALDGVRVFDPTGKAIGHIHLPERCANVCFGGAMGNRLFMASSHSLYSLFVNSQGVGFDLG